MIANCRWFVLLPVVARKFDAIFRLYSHWNCLKCPPCMNRWCSIPYWSLGRFHNVRLMMMMTRQRLEKKKKKKTTKLKSSLVRVCLGQRQSLCLWRYLWRYKAKGIKRETYSPSIRRNICDSVDPFWPESKSSVNTTLPFNGNIKIKMMARLKLFTFIFKFDIFSGVAFVALDYFTMHRQVSQTDRQSTYTLRTPSCAER